MSCPAFQSALQPGEGAGVAHAVTAVDCHVDAAVQGAYGRLFGQGGAFGMVLTALLTLYVAAIALGLMTGRTRLTLSGMAPRVLAIGLVLTFATSWPAYQAVVYGLLTGGPEEIARVLAGPAGSPHLFAERLDAMFDRFAVIAKALGDSTAGGSKALGPLAGPQMAAGLVWVSGLSLLLSSAGVLVLTRVVLALLLAMGPVFIVLGLFRPTRGLLEAWLRTAMVFAVAPLLAVVAGAGALALLGPLVELIAQDPQAAVTDLRPVLELFMGAMVHLGLTAMLLWVAGSLAAGWRLFGAASPEGGAEARQVEAGPAGAAAAAALAPSPAEPRVAQIVSALSREGAGGGTAPADLQVRVEQLAAAPRADGIASPSAPGAPGQDRVQGLGQSFRPAGPAKPSRLAGAIQ